MVNFVDRFLPDMAAISEPIRRLVHESTFIHWRKPQQVSLPKLDHKWAMLKHGLILNINPRQN